MEEKWIGNEDNTSGSYVQTECEELLKDMEGT